MEKSADAFRTISEAAGELGVPQHVLRFWETRFPQIKPLKRAGGRRYYRPRDIEILQAVKHLLYGQGYTIKGVQRLLKEQGSGALARQEGAAGSSENSFASPGGWETDESLAPPRMVSPLADLGEPQDEPGRLPAAGAKGIARLRAALAMLAECQAILASARR
ncbi:MAG: MerR family transcriptional regulator, partial [Methylocapsa sp.]|nr:MerR family transcriptional regulator [Methylocapsa sp.]